MLKSIIRKAGAAAALAVSITFAGAGGASAQFPSIGGDLTPYLIGAFDFIRPLMDSDVTAMENRYTVHNPTNLPLRFIAAPFDFSGAPTDIAGVTCWSGDLRGNGSSFLAVAADLTFPTVFSGTLKIVALDKNGKPAAGIVGFMERFVYRNDEREVVAGSRSNLASIPDVALRKGELEKITDACGAGFGGATDLTAAGGRAESEDGRLQVQSDGHLTLERHN